MKRIVVIALIVIGLCGICTVAAAMLSLNLVQFLVGSGQAVGDSANSFMVAIRDGEIEKAYEMLAPSLRDEVGLGSFREQFVNSGLKDWRFTQFSIQNDLGYVAGSAEDAEASHFAAFQLIYQDNQWVISGYNLGALGQAGTVIDPGPD